MPDASGTTAKIAIALSLAAVITVGIAVVVVATREAPSVAAPPSKGTDDRDDRPEHRRVRASDVVRLDRESVEAVAGGIKVTDRELSRALSLEPDDVITAISGKTLKRQFDVYDALLGVSMMNATTLYLEVTHNGAATLVRWDLDGDLREARKRAAPR